MTEEISGPNAQAVVKISNLDNNDFNDHDEDDHGEEDRQQQ